MRAVMRLPAQTAELEHGYQIAADAGSYAITGSGAALEKTTIFAADAGSYAITGATPA